MKVFEYGHSPLWSVTHGHESIHIDTKQCGLCRLSASDPVLEDTEERVVKK